MAWNAYNPPEGLGLRASIPACPHVLSQWMRDEFSRILPFRSLIALYGITHSGGATPTHLFQVDFPMAHLHQIRNKAGAPESPLARKWMKERKAFVFDPKLHTHWPEIDRDWLRSFQSHGLVNAVVSGFIDESICTGSYLSLHGVPGHALRHAAETLEVWSRPLHEMLLRCVERTSALYGPTGPRWDLLTPKEMIIAKAAAQGKGNLAIANELGLCESTVKTHMNNVLGKLKLNSRTELCVAFNEWPPEGMRGIHVLP